MMIKKSLATVFIAAMVFLSACSKNVESANLERALDVTSDTLDQFEATQGSQAQGEVDLQAFTAVLATNMNLAMPKVHADPLGMELNTDGSMTAYHDGNNNAVRDSGERDLFKIEVDAERNRLIATDTNGYARDRSFSGTGLLTGLLIGSLLSRQRAAGVRPGSFANRNVAPKGSSPSARSRTGSGSHSSGK